MNILPATLVRAGAATRVRVATQPPFDVPLETPAELEGAAVQFGVRPEDLSIATDERWLIEGRVAYVESLGELTQLYVDIGLDGADGGGGEPEDRLLVVKLPGMLDCRRGETLRLVADVSRVHLFDADGAAIAHAQASGPIGRVPSRGFGPMVEPKTTRERRPPGERLDETFVSPRGDAA